MLNVKSMSTRSRVVKCTKQYGNIAIEQSGVQQHWGRRLHSADQQALPAYRMGLYPKWNHRLSLQIDDEEEKS